MKTVVVVALVLAAGAAFGQSYMVIQRGGTSHVYGTEVNSSGTNYVGSFSGTASRPEMPQSSFIYDADLNNIVIENRYGGVGSRYRVFNDAEDEASPDD